MAIATTLVSAACSRGANEERRHYTAGNRLFAKKQYKEALVEYQRAVAIDERYGEARYRLALTYEALQQPEQAFKEAIRAADLLPTRSDPQIKACRYLLAAGQYDDAKERAQRVLQRDAKNVDALLIVGNAMAGVRDISGAVAQVEEAIELDPHRSLSYTNLALLQLALGDRQQAQAAFEKAVTIDPASVPGWLALANYQWSIGDKASAEQSLQKAYKLEPANLIVNRALAAFYVSSDRAADAEPHLKVIAAQTSSVGARLTLADYYVFLDRPADATSILRAMTADRNTYAAAESRLAAIVYASGDTTRAHAMLDKVLSREPNNARARLFKAQWLFRERRLPAAIEQAKAAVNADEQSATARYLLATIQLAANQRQDAMKTFGEVLRLNPRASAAQLQLSRLQLARGASDSAVQLAEEALRNAPASLDARLLLVRGWIARGDTARSRAELAALSREHPDAAEVHALQGLMALLDKDLTGARDAYERALHDDPGLIDALTGITTIDVLQGKTNQARLRLEGRLPLDPDRPELLLLSAKAAIADKDLDAAEQSLRRMIQIDPMQPEGFSLLGRIYDAEHKLDDARLDFDQLATRDPQNLAAQIMSAMIVHSQQNVQEAKRRYTSILARQPHAAVAANNLAWIYADEGENLDLALTLAQSAAEDMPDRPEVHDTVGWVYIRKGVPSLAIQSVQRSIQRNPDNPLYYYHLALAYAMTGDAENARQAITTALKLQPDFSAAQRLLQSLPRT